MTPEYSFDVACQVAERQSALITENDHAREEATRRRANLRSEWHTSMTRWPPWIDPTGPCKVWIEDFVLPEESATETTRRTI